MAEKRILLSGAFEVLGTLIAVFGFLGAFGALAVLAQGADEGSASTVPGLILLLGGIVMVGLGRALYYLRQIAARLARRTDNTPDNKTPVSAVRGTAQRTGEDEG